MTYKLELINDQAFQIYIMTILPSLCLRSLFFVKGILSLPPLTRIRIEVGRAWLPPKG